MWYKVTLLVGVDDLNSEFSSFKTGCLTKAKELNLSYYLPVAEMIRDKFKPAVLHLKK